MPSATAWFVVAIMVCGIGGFSISTNQNTFLPRSSIPETQQQGESRREQHDKRDSIYRSTVLDDEPQSEEDGDELPQADGIFTTSKDRMEEASTTNHGTKGQTDPPARSKQTSKLTDSQNSGSDTTLITDKGTVLSSSTKSLSTQTAPSSNALRSVHSGGSVLVSQKNRTVVPLPFPHSKHGKDPGYVTPSEDQPMIDSVGRKNEGHQNGREDVTHKRLQHDVTKTPLEKRESVVDGHGSQKNPKTNDSRGRSTVANTSVSPSHKDTADRKISNRFNSDPTNRSDNLQNSRKEMGVSLNDKAVKTETTNLNFDNRKNKRNSANSPAAFRNIDNREAATGGSSDKTKVEMAASQSISVPKTSTKAVKPETVNGNTGGSNLQQPVAGHLTENGGNRVPVSSSKVQPPVIRRIRPDEMYELPKITSSEPSGPIAINSNVFANKIVAIRSRHPSVFVPREPKRSTGSQTDTPEKKTEVDPGVMFPETQALHEKFTNNYTEKDNISMPDNTHVDTNTGTPRSVSKMNESGDELDHGNILNSSNNSSSLTVETRNSVKDHDFYQMTPIEYQVAHQDKTQREPSNQIVFTSSSTNAKSPHNLTENADDHVRESQRSISSNESSLSDQDRNRRGRRIINDTIHLILSEDDTPSHSNNFTEAISIPMSSLPSATKQDSQSSSKLSKKSKVPIPTKFSANVPNRSNASEISTNKDLHDYARQGGQVGSDDRQVISSSHNLQLVKESNASHSELNPVSHFLNQSVEGVSVTNKTESDPHLQEAHEQNSDGYERENTVVKFSGPRNDDRNAPPLQQDIQAPYHDRSRYYRYTIPYYTLVKRKGQLIAKRTNVLQTRSSQRPTKKIPVLPNSGISTRELNNNNYSHFKKQITDNSRFMSGIQAAESYPTLKAYSLVHEIVKSTKSDHQGTGQNHPKKDVNTRQSTLKPNIWYDRMLGLRLGGSHPNLNSRRSLKQRQVSAIQRPDKLSRSPTQPLKDPPGKRTPSRMDEAKHDQAANVRQNSRTILSRGRQHPIKTTDTLDTFSRANAFKDIPPSNKAQGITSRPNQSNSKMGSFSKVYTDRGLMRGRRFPGENEKSLDLKLSKTTHSALKTKDKVENVRPLQAPKSEFHSMTTVKIPTQHSEQTDKQTLSKIDSRTDALPDTDTIRDSQNEDSIGEKVNDMDANENTFTSESVRIFLKEKSTPEVAETSTKAGRDLTPQIEQGNAHLQSDRETSSLATSSSPSIIKQKSPVVSQRSVNNPRRIVYNEKVRSPASIHVEHSSLHPKTFHSLGSLRPGGKKSNPRSRPGVDPSLKNARLGQPLLPPRLSPGTRRNKPDVQKQERITVRSNKLRPPVPHPLHQDSDAINTKRVGNKLPSVRPVPVLYHQNPNTKTTPKTSSQQTHFYPRENNHENITTVNNNNNSSSVEAAIQEYLSTLADIYNGYPGYNTPTLPFQPMYPYVNPYAYANPYRYPVAPPSPYVMSGFPSAYSQPPYRGVSLLHSILNAGTSFADGISQADQSSRPSPLSKKSTSSTDSNGNKPARDRQDRGPANRNAPRETTPQIRPSLLSMPSTKTEFNGNNVAKPRQRLGRNALVNHQVNWYQTTRSYPATNYQPSVNDNSKTDNSKSFNSFQQPPSFQAPPAFPTPYGWLPVFPPLYLVDPRSLYGPSNYGHIPSLYSSPITQVPATHQIDERDLKAIEHFLLTKRGYKSWFGSNSKSGHGTKTKSHKTNTGVQTGATTGHLTDMDMKAIEHFLYTMPYYRRGNNGGGLGSLKLLTFLG